MKTWLRVLVPVAVFFALAACNKGSTLPDSSATDTVGSTGNSGAQTGGIGLARVRPVPATVTDRSRSAAATPPVALVP